jgi:hypothetical protein
MNASITIALARHTDLAGNTYWRPLDTATGKGQYVELDGKKYRVIVDMHTADMEWLNVRISEVKEVSQ